MACSEICPLTLFFVRLKLRKPGLFILTIGTCFILSLIFPEKVFLL